MDLFNVFKRYVQFGEQSNTRTHMHIVTELIKWPTSFNVCHQTKERKPNEHIIFIQIDAHAYTLVCTKPHSTHKQTKTHTFGKMAIKFIANNSVNR